MYDELIKRLREPCQYENCVLCQQAVDAIEELSKLADAIPHVCECCIGCEVETGGCDNAFVLSPKRAKEYLSKPHWIPVTERLPSEELCFYSCYTDKGVIVECLWTNNKYGLGPSGEWGWRWMDVPQYQRITHWMPLPPAPEPPKGET